MFASDRDLLVLEPNLFRDVAWAGQRLVSATGSISGTTLTVSGVDFAALGVTTGHVAVVAGVPVEVLARLSATTATVSRLRADPADAGITPAAAAGAPVAITTFGPQIGIAHRQALRLLGIEPGGWGESVGVQSGELTEASVTNPGALRVYVSLAALHLIYAAAAGVGGTDSLVAEKMAMYRERLASERQRVSAGIDLDGDGLPDVVRRLNAVVLGRA